MIVWIMNMLRQQPVLGYRYGRDIYKWVNDRYDEDYYST